MRLRPMYSDRRSSIASRTSVRARSLRGGALGLRRELPDAPHFVSPRAGPKALDRATLPPGAALPAAADLLGLLPPLDGRLAMSLTVVRGRASVRVFHVDWCETACRPGVGIRGWRRPRSRLLRG